MSKIRVKKTANNITPAARNALKRIKTKHFINQSGAIERAVLMLEKFLNQGLAL